MDARGRIRLHNRSNGTDNLGHMGQEKEEMRTREERRQRAREVRWMIGVGAMLCLTFWGGMAFAFWVMR